MNRTAHTRIAFGTALALPLMLALSACNSDDNVESAPGTEEAQAGPQFGGEVDSSPEGIEAAKKQALEIAGVPDGALQTAPEPREMSGDLTEAATINQALAGANAGGTQPDCAAAAEFGNEWATRLPGSFPIYPGASVTESAGTDAGGCTLRVVNFVTAVPRQEVMNFYYTLAANEGYSTQRVMSGAEDTLGGSSGDSHFTVIGRDRQGGGADFDLIVSSGS